MRRFAVLVLLSAILESSVFAGCNILPRLICAEYSQSKLVVITKLVGIKHFQPKDAQDYYVYDLEPIRILRGKVGKRFQVWEENSSGRASFTWSIGNSYLLFLHPTDDGQWWLYGCGNSESLDKAEFALKVIETLKDRKGGVIQGRVSHYGEYPVRSGLSGITIEIRGEKAKYNTVANRYAEFKIHVPAGHYTAIPVRPGWTFTKDFESFEDPDNINIENGGCAQLEFQLGSTPGLTRPPDHLDFKFPII